MGWSVSALYGDRKVVRKCCFLFMALLTGQMNCLHAIAKTTRSYFQVNLTTYSSHPEQNMSDIDITTTLVYINLPYPTEGEEEHELNIKPIPHVVVVVSDNRFKNV